MDARSYWNEIYAVKNNAKDDRKPSLFLSEIWVRLSKGLTLDLAMGSGENAVFLAQQGFSVRGFDVSDVAVDKTLEYAKKLRLSLEAHRCDLDLHVFGLMEYDSILMMNFKPSISRYYSEIIRSLKQGGTLLIEAPLISEMKEAIGKNEAYKDIYFHNNEVLRELGKDLRILFYNEGQVNGVNRVQCLAMKPIDRDAEKYKLFDLSASNTSDSSRASKQLELAEKLFSSPQKK